MVLKIKRQVENVLIFLESSWIGGIRILYLSISTISLVSSVYLSKSC